MKNLIALIIIAGGFYWVLTNPSFVQNSVSNNPKSRINEYNIEDYENVSATKSSKSPDMATKEILDSLAWKTMKAYERDDGSPRVYLKEMILSGADKVNIGSDRYNPSCPYSKPPKLMINGKILTGNLCIKLTYKYNGKNYTLGYCK